MTTLLLHLPLLLAGLGTLALPAIHRRDGDRGGRRRGGLGRANGRRLQHGSLGDYKGFDGFAEILHEMKAINHLHRLRCPPTNAVRIAVTPITADDGDRRMLSQPGRHRRGRALRQQVHDAMCREIDQHRALAVAPPPGPLVDADRLEGWRGWDRSPPYQAEQGGRTGRYPQAGGEPGPCLPA